MTLYVGDKGPKTVPFSVETGAVNGTTAASGRLKVSRPDGVEVEWSTGTLTTTVSTVAFNAVLQSDGSSLPIAGVYWGRVWLYSSVGVVIFDSDDMELFEVKRSKLTWPS